MRWQTHQTARCTKVSGTLSVSLSCNETGESLDTAQVNVCRSGRSSGNTPRSTTDERDRRMLSSASLKLSLYSPKSYERAYPGIHQGDPIGGSHQGVPEWRGERAEKAGEEKNSTKCIILFGAHTHFFFFFHSLLLQRRNDRGREKRKRSYQSH